MAGKKEILARQKQKAGPHGFPNSTDYPIDSAMRRILEQLEQNKGIIKVNNKATYDGKGIDLNALVSCLHILANPLHPENRWACVVEMVKYDDEAYLRLVPSIPLEVKEKWEATGKPPRQMAINDVQEMISLILGGAGVMRGGSGSVVTRSDNPYDHRTKYHVVFNMAGDWIPFTTLLSRIRDELCKGNDGNARSLLNLVAKRAGRSHLQSRISADGVRMVRAVPGPA